MHSRSKSPSNIRRDHHPPWSQSMAVNLKIYCTGHWRQLTVLFVFVGMSLLALHVFNRWVEIHDEHTREYREHAFLWEHSCMNPVTSDYSGKIVKTCREAQLFMSKGALLPSINAIVHEEISHVLYLDFLPWYVRVIIGWFVSFAFVALTIKFLINGFECCNEMRQNGFSGFRYARQGKWPWWHDHDGRNV